MSDPSQKSKKLGPIWLIAALIVAGVSYRALNGGRNGDSRGAVGQIVSPRETNHPAIVGAPDGKPSAIDAPTKAAVQTVLDPNKAPINPLRDKMSRLVKELTGTSDPDQQSRLLDQAIRSIQPGEHALALAALGSPEFGKNGKIAFGRVLGEWSGKDPSAASQWVGMMSAGADRLASVSIVARSWAGQDADRSIDWVRSLQSEDERRSGLMTVSYELAQTDPKKALTLAFEFFGAPGADDLIAHAATRWGENDPQGAASWAKQIENATLRDQVLAGVLTTWSTQDPSAAASAAIEGMQPGRKQNDALISIIQRWAEKEPKTVSEWVSGFTEGPLKTTAVEELTKSWAEQNLNSTEEWIRSLPAGITKDTAAAAFAQKIVLANPAAAAGWAAGITQPEMRQQEINKVMSVWLKTDEKAALEWKSKAGAPPLPSPQE